MTDLETEIRTALHDRVRHITPDQWPHAERDERIFEGTNDVIVLQPVRSPRRLRPAVWLTAAAVASLLALTSGVVLAVTRDAGQTPAGPVALPLPGITAEQLRQPFVLDKATGFVVSSVGVDEGQDPAYRIVGQNSELSLTLTSRAPARSAAATSVQVAGTPGWYEARSASASEGDPGRTLVWESDAGRWAVLESHEQPSATTEVSEASLLKVAGGLDFAKQPELRSALAITAAPDGFTLTGFWTMTATDPVRASLGRWGSGATFTPDRTAPGELMTAPGISVNVTPRGLSIGPTAEPAVNTADAVPVTVAGHSGYWSADSHELSLALGRGAFLDIYATGDEDAAHQPTYEQMAAIVPTVALASNVSDPTSWPNAAQALPLG